MVGDAVAVLERRVHRHPYGMVAAAAGLGFVVGGGLFTRLTARVVGAGLRVAGMAALPLVRDEMRKRRAAGAPRPG